MIGSLWKGLALAAAFAAPAAAQSPRPLVIRGSEFAFQTSDTVPAGPTVISLDNVGEVSHEMIVYVLKDGKTGADVVAAKTMAERAAVVDGFVGAINAQPGGKSLGGLVTTLVRGRSYVLLCTIREQPDKPSHLMQGMMRVLYVR